MKKLISSIWLLLFVTGITACTNSPVKTTNPQEQQRSHSREAQEELSNAVIR